MSKKDELLTQDVLEKIEKANTQELKELVVESMKQARKYNELMRDDQKLQVLLADKKALEGGYKDKIQACQLVADLALSKLEAKEELSK